MKLLKFRKHLFVLLVMSVFFVGCNKDSDIERLKADGYSKYEITKKINKALKDGQIKEAERLQEYLRQRKADWCYLDYVRLYENEVEGMILRENKR